MFHQALLKLLSKYMQIRMQICMAEDNMSVLKHAGVRFFRKHMANWVHQKH